MPLLDVLIVPPAHAHHRRGSVTTTLAPNALTALDRCDRCGAQAYVRVTLATGGDLLFCAHHFRAHEGKLRGTGARVIDETRRLADSPEPH
jgi:hypothetical protein